MLQYWLSKARGGVGLILTHVHNVMPGHMGAPPVALQSDAMIPAYRRVADALHDENVKFLVQLNHPGGTNNSRPFGGVLLAPSALPPSRNTLLPAGIETPHEMEISDIKTIVQAFGEASVRVREAGSGASAHIPPTYRNAGILCT
jgi:2,4-dienoyl-CoA reductase-like NADH-dependent reductase (Old Yellow Enzyme family)